MGLAQNEMKAKPALPERVRSMEGLALTVPVLRITKAVFQAPLQALAPAKFGLLP